MAPKTFLNVRSFFGQGSALASKLALGRNARKDCRLEGLFEILPEKSTDHLLIFGGLPREKIIVPTAGKNPQLFGLRSIFEKLLGLDELRSRIEGPAENKNRAADGCNSTDGPQLLRIQPQAGPELKLKQRFKQ